MAMTAARGARRIAACAALVLLATTPVAADWQRATARDAATGRDGRQVFAVSRVDAATLRYGCANGAPLLWIDLDRDLARGLVESTLIFDARAPQPLMLQVFSNPRRLPLVDLSLTDVARARRMRLELRPLEAAVGRYDFDIRGGRKAMAEVSCGPRKPSLLKRLTGRAGRDQPQAQK
jgi:hypothetical protein